MPRYLILVPTALERRGLDSILAPIASRGCGLELCGFGPVAAAARTAHLLAEHAPDRVLLVGIAGGLDDRLPVGAAERFDRVACYGIGAGSGSGFLSAETLGWHQWPGDATGRSPQAGGQGSEPIGDVIACGTGGGPGLLLSACAAAATAEDVRLRRRAYPAASAEDMEGYAVALACRLRGVPLDIVRGISNAAGDRDASRWRVAAALEAAGRLALSLLAEAT